MSHTYDTCAGVRFHFNQDLSGDCLITVDNRGGDDEIQQLRVPIYHLLCLYGHWKKRHRISSIELLSDRQAAGISQG